MRELRAHLIVALMGATFGCSLAHVARLPADVPDENEARAAIETCLSSIGLQDVSDEWPYSEIIADHADAISAWATPPPESTWDQLFGSYKHAQAWVQKSEINVWSVRFVKHDESFPPAFATCMSELDPNVPVEIESDWYFDLSRSRDAPDHVGVPGRVVARETAELGQPQFAKTCSRPLLGTLNDFALNASAFSSTLTPF